MTTGSEIQACSFATMTQEQYLQDILDDSAGWLAAAKHSRQPQTRLNHSLTSIVTLSLRIPGNSLHRTAGQMISGLCKTVGIRSPYIAVLAALKTAEDINVSRYDGVPAIRDQDIDKLINWIDEVRAAVDAWLALQAQQKAA